MNCRVADAYELSQSYSEPPLPLQVPAYLNAGARQFGFMLRGLKLMQPKLEALNIPFFLLKGDPVQTVPELVEKTGASLLVTDFASLSLGREWRQKARSMLCLVWPALPPARFNHACRPAGVVHIPLVALLSLVSGHATHSIRGRASSRAGCSLRGASQYHCRCSRQHCPCAK